MIHSSAIQQVSDITIITA